MTFKEWLSNKCPDIEIIPAKVKFNFREYQGYLYQKDSQEALVIPGYFPDGHIFVDESNSLWLVNNFSNEESPLGDWIHFCKINTYFKNSIPSNKRIYITLEVGSNA